MSESTVSTRRAQTRDKLMDAALAVFADKGVQAATVEEVCERAGYTRGAFYSNYDSMDDLCAAAWSRFAHEAETSMRAAVAVVPITIDGDDDVAAVVDAALDVALGEAVASPTRVLAQLEIRLHFLRNPQLASGAPQMDCINDVMVELLNAKLERVGYVLRVPTASVIEMLWCVVEALTAHGEGTVAIRARVAELLKALIVPRA